MSRPSLAGQSGSDALSISDFELVRNAKGEWLLIVSQAPAAFLDNPMHTLEARLDGTTIVLTGAGARMHLQNILSSQYVAGLESDRPATLLFSVVDDDGTQAYSARVPFIWS